MIIQSPVKEIARLRFCNFPGRPFKITKAVRVDKTLYALLPNGVIAFYKGSEAISYPPHSSPWMINLTAALAKLGVITPQQASEHKAACMAGVEKSERRWAATRIKQDAGKLGIKFTKAQLRKIETRT